MVDETGKGEEKKAMSSTRGRPRAAMKPAPAKPAPAKAVAGSPVLPAEPAIPAVLAKPAPGEPAPAVAEASAPVPEAATPKPDAVSAPQHASMVLAPSAETAAAPAAATTFEPAAPVASFEKKETKMNETVTSFAEKAQEQTKTAFANVGEQTRGAVEKTRKVAEDMAEFGKGNVEALVESTRIAAQAFETMGQDAATFARTQYESTAQMIQSLASVKSPNELMQIQAEYVRTAFDALVKEASRSTEATLKLAGDVAKPLQNRLATAADKFRPAA
ncbi:phasin family protein [Sphingomonas phyllosphaerae]|uniref:phasin family protein n=1 Tax=Sphingomonas phyllosphaerae TaxID=257003 RepID=UPI0003B74F49|nr:phasin family protein [Sphingomonas phyllosphaerae]